MHNLKRLLLVSTLCIAMAFPSTALANEVITTDITTEAAEVVDVEPASDITIADETVADETVADDTAADETVADDTLPAEDTDVTDDVTTDQTPDDTTDDIAGDETDVVVDEEPETPTETTPDYDGLVTIEGKKYYYKNGEMVKNKVVKIDDYRYYFTADGSAYTTTGTLVDAPDGHQYTFRSSGKAYKSVVKKFDGKYYYFGRNSYLFSKVGYLAKVGDNYYTFNEDGTVFTEGLKKVKSNYYYFQKSGKALKDKLKTIDGGKYYFRSNGRASKTWRVVDGKLYRFGTKGKALTGWRYRDSNETWYYMDPTTKYYTFKGNPLRRAYNKIKNASSDTNYIICVDSTSCRCSIFIRMNGKWVPDKYWKCSPGKTSTPTVFGWYKVGARGYSFGGGSYTCYYYTQFYGDYLFHSVLYHKGTFNIKKGTLGHRLSHGCVRLDINNAKWIYDNIPTGTTVCSYL